MNTADQGAFLLAFGKKLAQIRIQKGVSQEQLAFDADMSLSAISKLERGELNVSIGNALSIAKALNVKIRDLFEI